MPGRRPARAGRGGAGLPRAGLRPRLRLSRSAAPLAGGFLSGKFSRDGEGPAGARRANFDFPPVDRERAFDCVDAMRKVAEAHDATVARVALSYLLHKPFVTSVIIGARTDAQLQDDLAAADRELTDDEMAALDEVSALPPEYPGWMVAFQQRERRPPPEDA